MSVLRTPVLIVGGGAAGLPHAWLRRGGERVATHDLVRRGAFLLLAGAHGEAWCAAAARCAAAVGVGLDAYRVAEDGDLRDDTGDWARLRGHDEHGAVLVRPDGHVAFRAAGAVDDHAATLWQALATAHRTGGGAGAGRAAGAAADRAVSR